MSSIHTTCRYAKVPARFGAMTQALRALVSALLVCLSLAGCGEGGSRVDDAGNDATTAMDTSVADSATGSDSSSDDASESDANVIGDADVTDSTVESDAEMADASSDAATDVCAPSPCLNGGTCSDVGGIATCSCANGYEGELCEVTPCTDNPCLHGGTCTVAGSGFSCACQAPYTGATCQLQRTCTGTPMACAIQPQTIACGNVPGCSNMATCTGTASPCIDFDSVEFCETQLGCTWSGTSCTGTPPACAPGTCALGCAQGNVCAGAPTVGCAYFAVDLTQCPMVAGCAVTEVPAP